MPRLVTEWSTDDEGLAETLRLIAETPEHSIERLELEGALHAWQAKWCFERAAIRRHDQERDEARRAAAAATRARNAAAAD